MKTTPPMYIRRWDLINELIPHFHYRRYLEIGCRFNTCFNRIRCDSKTGVDPVCGGTHRLTSDQFFQQNQETFDMVFIDGLHHSEQVVQDVTNALRVLDPNGTIALHDCLPTRQRQQRRPRPRWELYWSGDVWKAVVEFRYRPDLDVAVGNFDHGVAVIRTRPNTAPPQASFLPQKFSQLEWPEYRRHFSDWLRPLSYPQLLEWAKSE